MNWQHAFLAKVILTNSTDQQFVIHIDKANAVFSGTESEFGVKSVEIGKNGCLVVILLLFYIESANVR